MPSEICGKPGMVPSSMRLAMAMEDEASGPSADPKMPT
jgi:hypothetical protein